MSLPAQRLDDALSPHLHLRDALTRHDARALRAPPQPVLRALEALRPADLAPTRGPDEHARFARQTDGPAHGDPARTARYLDALGHVLARPHLDADALGAVMARALGAPAPLRSTDAFARGGAHRYPWRDDLPARLTEALAQAADPTAHPVVRGALVYLDLIFLHPFEDGNARAARLAMHHTLHRGGLGAPRFEDVLWVRKTPGDPEALWRLVRITAASIAAVARSRAHGSRPA